MKIAVMGAMPEEIEPILERMDSYETIEYAKNIYYEGKYRAYRYSCGILQDWKGLCYSLQLPSY